jgi:hypothetical protein
LAEGGWAMAQSPILGTTITVDRLKQRGYISMLEIYKKISPQLNEPLYTRPVLPVPIISAGYSGVRGALAAIWSSATYSITASFFVLVTSIRIYLFNFSLKPVWNTF